MHSLSRRTCLAALLALLTLPACESSPKFTTLPSGLQFADLTVGTGEEAKNRDNVEIHYIGRLPDGRVFMDTYNRGASHRFMLGVGRAIKGWDEGIVGMKVGGKRRLIVPPALGYPRNRKPAAVPLDTPVEFDIELLAVKPPSWNPKSGDRAKARAAEQLNAAPTTESEGTETSPDPAPEP